MGRAPCCDKSGLKKGPWTAEEDQKLIDYIQKHGHGSWRTLPKNAGLARCGKSCRLRWANYLRPDIKRGRFSFEEEETIIQLHSVLGNKWSAIAARLPGRTDNEIKNYWNTHIRKRLLRMGIDPVTHSSRLDLVSLSSLLKPGLYPQNQLDVSRLLSFGPLLKAELLRIAANLLQSHCRKPNLFSQTQLSESQPQQQLPSTLLQNPAQCISESEWGENGASFCNFVSDSFMSANNGSDNLSYENMEKPFSSLLSEPTSSQLLENQSLYSNLVSVLSTPESSLTLSNSSAGINNSTEGEKDSYCSNLLDFQIPDLLDMSEFMV